MPRANRHFLPGHVWHITHRCHKREFLLKFARDRRLWRYWLYEARKRYGLCVLNYIVTSNHIHLLVRDQGRGEIAPAMQLIAGRIGQAFNQRKGRKGAFWEDRYHATAVETGEHLTRCLVYIDLNMVRAGVVAHPSEWELSGYREIQSPPDRYRTIDQQALLEVLEIRTAEELRRSHRQWVEEALRSGRVGRDELWTEALAVGSLSYVKRVHDALGVGARKRAIEVVDDRACVREAPPDYTADYGPKIGVLRR
ncbi:transposase [Thioalkalivibrio denitrificans]|uniref:Transposase n=1 Tax=Thioalkalivibrio denitrificans TaxID=108003 RepID=A0A1V3N9I9_9GAMM|nr:transposase [Thioalkalivibrio denitrificans]OOG21466.1 transposase [Thioalkalivibrio denitrificans]